MTSTAKHRRYPARKSTISSVICSRFNAQVWLFETYIPAPAARTAAAPGTSGPLDQLAARLERQALQTFLTTPPPFCRRPICSYNTVLCKFPFRVFGVSRGLESGFSPRGDRGTVSQFSPRLLERVIHVRAGQTVKCSANKRTGQPSGCKPAGSIFAMALALVSLGRTLARWGSLVENPKIRVAVSASKTFTSAVQLFWLHRLWIRRLEPAPGCGGLVFLCLKLKSSLY